MKTKFELITLLAEARNKHYANTSLKIEIIQDEGQLTIKGYGAHRFIDAAALIGLSGYCSGHNEVKIF